MLNDAMQKCLEDGDVALARKLWKHVHPSMPQPATDGEAEIVIHIARTASRTVSFRARAYSHAWLRERRIPSQLPDHLRPRAERIYPVTIEGVGIAVNSISREPEMKELARQTVGVMSDVVLDHYEKTSSPDPVVVKRDMMRARADFVRGLLSSINIGWRR